MVAVLMPDSMSSTRRQTIRQRAQSAVNRTDVALMERVCTEDVPALLEQLDEVDGLRAALAEAQRGLRNAEEERDTFRTERNAAFVALRDALGTDPATLGQATLHAIKAVADRDAARTEAERFRAREALVQGQVDVVRRIGEADTARAAYEAMDAERRNAESRRAVDNVALADLRRERDDARAEVERLRADLAQCRSMLRQSERTAADLKEQVERQRGLDEELLAGMERDEAEVERLHAELAEIRAERDTAREEVRVLALGADPLCPDHGDYTTTGCESCAHASAVRSARSALDGTETAVADPKTAEQRVSTSPIQDEATGLETLCAFLHAAGNGDPNVIKDVAWRTFNLIRAWREQGAEVERLRAERTEIRAALIRELRASSRFRKAWKSARRGRKQARAELARPVADEDVRLTLRVLQAGDGTRRDGELLERAIRQAEAERGAAREEVRRVRKMHVSVILGGTCTACGHHAPCPTIRTLDEEAAKQVSPADATSPDPRLIALEELALRYSHAFEVLFADARARATRKKANHG